MRISGGGCLGQFSQGSDVRRCLSLRRCKRTWIEDSNKRVIWSEVSPGSQSFGALDEVFDEMNVMSDQTAQVSPADAYARNGICRNVRVDTVTRR